MLLVLGMPRSGTTWLAKIFDSHPQVLYRNEPDSVIRTKAIPPFSGPPYDPRQLEMAAEYLRTLRHVRSIKVVSTLPQFHKSYISTPMFHLHRTLVIGAKLGERVPYVGTWFNQTRIPDLVRSGGQPSTVIKSVTAMGRAALFMAACPDLKAILIVRHPCGHIASVLNGIRAGKFEASVPITEDMGVYRSLAALTYARKNGLSLAAFQAMSPVERLAWRWAITNTVAMEALNDNPRGQIIRYEDLCDDPVPMSRQLLSFAGLSWDGQTESFVNASTNSSTAERYYQVFRNPKAAASKWRQEMAADDIDRVLRITEQTPAGGLFTGH